MKLERIENKPKIIQAVVAVIYANLDFSDF